MGEITEALRRARREREARESGAPAPAAAPRILPDERPERKPLEAAPDHAPPGRQQHVPRTRRGFWQARAVVVNSHSPVAERYRHLALQTRRELTARGLQSLVVTSAVRAEGKTVTATNLALALASVASGRRVALVDLDLRRNSVSQALGIQPTVGIEAVLRGEAPLSAACVPTDAGGLDVFPVGESVHDAHEMLSTTRLQAIAEELLSGYALVVCDSPPVLPVPDVPLIVPHFGACLAVSRSGTTRQASFQEMLSLIPPDSLIGCVLNDAPRPAHAEHYDYYRPRTRSERRDDEEAAESERDEDES